MEESDNGYSNGLLNHNGLKSRLWVRVPPPPLTKFLSSNFNPTSETLELFRLRGNFWQSKPIYG